MVQQTPTYGFPYVESSDTLVTYPATSQELATDVESVITQTKPGVESYLWQPSGTVAITTTPQTLPMLTIPTSTRNRVGMVYIYCYADSGTPAPTGYLTFDIVVNGANARYGRATTAGSHASLFNGAPLSGSAALQVDLVVSANGATGFVLQPGRTRVWAQLWYN